ncbi:MAG: PD-(D/E)XK nuclease family protein [Aquincola tertiaricarbonis]
MTAPSLTVRASSWGGLFDCAYSWEGVHLLGMRKPSGMRAHLGTSIHASTAAFDNGRLPGASPLSVDDAAGVFIETLHTPRYELDRSQDDLSMRDAERIGLQLHTAYCFDLSPRFTFRSVEAQLQPLDIDCGGGIVVRLTGTMDRARVAETDAGVVIPDIKTGSRVIEHGQAKTKGRSAQLGTYQLMFEADTGEQTAGAQVLALQTSSKPHVAASEVFDAKRVMVGTETSRGLISHAAEMFRTGLFAPNPQSMLCSPKYCARWDTCSYHE